VQILAYKSQRRKARNVQKARKIRIEELQYNTIKKRYEALNLEENLFNEFSRIILNINEAFKKLQFENNINTAEDLEFKNVFITTALNKLDAILNEDQKKTFRLIQFKAMNEERVHKINDVKSDYIYLNLSEEQAEKIYIYKINRSQKDSNGMALSKWEFFDQDLKYMQSVLDASQMDLFIEKLDGKRKYHVEELDKLNVKHLIYNKINTDALQFIEERLLDRLCLVRKEADILFSKSSLEKINALKNSYRQTLLDRFDKNEIKHYRHAKNHCPALLSNLRQKLKEALLIPNAMHLSDLSIWNELSDKERASISKICSDVKSIHQELIQYKADLHAKHEIENLNPASIMFSTVPVDHPYKNAEAVSFLLLNNDKEASLNLANTTGI